MYNFVFCFFKDNVCWGFSPRSLAILPQCHFHSCLVYHSSRKKLSTLGHLDGFYLLTNIILLSYPFLQVSLPIPDDFPRINSYEQKY